MATKGEPSITGRMLSKLRAERGWTAEELAARVPDDSITRTVITNVESGRKRDLTATELAQLAAALNVSPIALLVDIDRPFDPVEIPGLPRSYAELTTAEYLRVTNAFSLISDPRGRKTLTPLQSGFIDALERAEKCELMYELSRNIADGPYPAGTVTRKIEVELPDEVVERLRGPEADGLIFEHAQGVVDYYRQVVGLRAHLAGQSAMPASLQERIEALRAEVVEIIRDWPGIDYGQSDRTPSPFEPVLNPSNGRAIGRG